MDDVEDGHGNVESHYFKARVKARVAVEGNPDGEEEMYEAIDCGPTRDEAEQKAMVLLMKKVLEGPGLAP